MVKPIKPSEVTKTKAMLPDEVLEAFNELITHNFSGGSACFRQKEVETLILKKFKKNGKQVSGEDIYKNHWLDVEGIYRKAGWKVNFDQPRSYSATFTFSK